MTTIYSFNRLNIDVVNKTVTVYTNNEGRLVIQDYIVFESYIYSQDRKIKVSLRTNTLIISDDSHEF